MKYVAMIILLAVGLTGCGAMSDKSVMSLVNESGEIVGTIAGTAAQRDYFYTNQHVERDRQSTKQFEMSGVHVKMEKVDLPGGGISFLPTEFTVRGNPQFQQNLETRPPDHRGWDTVDKGLGIIKDLGIGWLLNDFGKTAVKEAGTKYMGSYSVDSFNQTAEPFIVTPEVIQVPTY